MANNHYVKIFSIKMYICNSSITQWEPLFSPQNVDFHQHNTRHHKDPHVVSRKSSVASKSFIHAAPKIWFELRANIKIF